MKRISPLLVPRKNRVPEKETSGGFVSIVWRIGYGVFPLVQKR